MAKKREASPKKAKTAPRASSKSSKPGSASATAGTLFEDSKRSAKPAASQTRTLTLESIGDTAGHIWQVLSEQGVQTLAGVKKAVDASDDQVMLALGWLAREDIVAFDNSGRTVRISLT